MREDSPIKGMTQTQRLAFYKTEEGKEYKDILHRRSYEILERQGPTNRFSAMALASLRMKFNGFSEKPLKLD